MASFLDVIFKLISLNEIFCIYIQISLKFVPKVSFDKMSALLQVMAWYLTGTKPLPEPVVALFTGA